MSDEHFLVFLIVAVLALFMIYLSIDHHLSMKREREINRELLDRLMSRDFPNYAAGVAAIARAEAERPRTFGETVSEMTHGKKDLETDSDDDGLGMPVT
jgi:hypothetical protein